MLKSEFMELYSLFSEQTNLLVTFIYSIVLTKDLKIIRVSQLYLACINHSLLALHFSLLVATHSLLAHIPHFSLYVTHSLHLHV